MLEPLEILELAAFIGLIAVPVTQGLTGAFKSFFPDANVKLFSIVLGALTTAVSWLATTPIPDSAPMWAAAVLVDIIGALLPSGFFDKQVNVTTKAIKNGFPITELEEIQMQEISETE